MTPLDPLVLEAYRSARAAKLRYVTDMSAGIRRIRAGKGFSYQTQRGRRVHNPAVLERIRLLVIPPAWQEVWICPWANGHIQASGFDARGRKQYRYHTAWQQVRDEEKYGKLVLFAQALPAIRRRVSRDLRRRGMPREKVLAAVVRLLELTRIRVGNDEYARTNATFGLTTIRNKHTQVRGSVIRFDFQGKHQIKHEIEVQDSELAGVVRRCQQLPGEELFEYVEADGAVRDVKSEDVNEYLRTIAGREFSAKDFRTWSGTITAACELARMPPAASRTAAKRALAQAVAKVAEHLRNTKAVCRKCYIHPAVTAAYLEGNLGRELRHPRPAPLKSGLRAHEAAVLGLLQRYYKRRGRVHVTVKVQAKAG
jgi:DNA topoisomerase-1